MDRLRHRRVDFICDVYDMTPKHYAYGSFLQQRIEGQGLGQWVKLHQAIPHPEVPALLQAADLLLIPRQDSELNRSNLPTKLVDYLMSGRPVVSSRVGEILNYAEDRVHIVYPRDASAEAFADAVESLAAAPEQAEQIGRAGRQMAMHRFHYRRVGEHIRDFLSCRT
jgi:glycosyltransferase involved in cell wall biosynthesis